MSLFYCITYAAVNTMFEHDRSAVRGLMSTRQLIVFQHNSALGNAPAHSLFDRVKIERIDKTKPAREFGDYRLVINKEDLPQSVNIVQKP